MENVELGNLGTISVEQAITAIYIGYYNRAPDPVGLAFHVSTFGQPTAGGDGVFGLDDIATDFSTQAETAAVHSFFSDPSATSALAFLNSVYLNLFGRQADQEGIDYWVPILEAAVAGEDGAISVGETILQIIQGAQNTDAGQDLARIQNKIDVGLDYAGTAGDVADLDYENNADAQAAAKAALAGVTDEAASVVEAKAGIAAFFDPILNPPVEGTTISLKLGESTPDGTDGDDLFDAGLAQSQFGNVANTLSSASDLDGGAGYDTLEASVTNEFTGFGDYGFGLTDIQPRMESIEEIKIEARDGDFLFGGFVTLDAKDITDVEVIGSHRSDGDLVIENLTTLTADGVARNTGDITIAMDHTDNFNSDDNASDLIVYFDNDYLINDAPVDSGALLTIELMDLDAETLGQDPLLDNPFGLITFNFDGELKTLDFGTGSNTYAELLEDVQAAITLAAQTDPDFSQLSASFGDPFVVQDTDTDPNPAQPDLTGTTIVITNSGPELLEAVTMRATGDAPAGKDFHTGFGNEAPETENFPISVDIDLHKAGRGGQGGDLVVGGKAQAVSEGIAGGIEVFNVSVMGEGADSETAGAEKPSNIGTLTSTLEALKTINIETHEDFAGGSSFASLEIRDGFNDNDDGDENGDLETVFANNFFGNLSLGTTDSIVNLDKLTALGGGDIKFNGLLNGQELAQAYSYMTGEGDDVIRVDIDGDALDHAGSSLTVITNGGDDMVVIDGNNILGTGDFSNFEPNERLNQAILDDINILTGDGDDSIISVVGSRGDMNIDAGAGNDFIDVSGGDDDGTADLAQWAFNYDDVRVNANPGGLSGYDGPGDTDDLPGVPTSLAYVGGATVTVTLSGAGTGAGQQGEGGGVMSYGVAGATQGDDGYEGRHTITGALETGNLFYGDQRDINAAVIAAIEESDVLSKLLSVEIAANNTLVIESKVGGEFDPDDLRIDITQKNLGAASNWATVQIEAREVFSNSGIAVTSTASANTPTGNDLTTSTTANEWYDGLSVTGDVINSVNIDSPDDDRNRLDQGEASIRETDNVINGGDGDDLIVMSTDATVVSGFPDVFTPIFGNEGFNTLQNGASNETIVMEGPDFGHDTVMNFSTALTEAENEDVDQTIVTETSTDGTEEAPIEGSPEAFVLDVSQVTATLNGYDVTFDGITVAVPGNTSPAALASLIQTAFAGPTGGGWSATAGPGVNEVTFTQTANGNIAPNVSILGDWDSSTPLFENTATLEVTDGVADGVEPATSAEVVLTFVDEALETLTDGEIVILGSTYNVPEDATKEEIAELVTATPPTGYTAVNNTGGVVTLTAAATGSVLPATVITDSTIDGTRSIDEVSSGLDFLDFTDYLNGQFDSSSGTGDSADSNIMIPVTLDYSQTNTLGGSGDGSTVVAVEANEVAAVRMLNDTTDGETFDTLDAADVANLFNNDGTFTGFGGDSSFGDLNAANFDVATYQKTDQEELIGDGKAVFMVEDSANLGEYKVFELTWSGDETATSGDTVAAVEIGSLDFGTSLTGLDDVNLVGSDDYAALLQNGFA